MNNMGKGFIWIILLGLAMPIRGYSKAFTDNEYACPITTRISSTDITVEVEHDSKAFIDIISGVQGAKWLSNKRGIEVKIGFKENTVIRRVGFALKGDSTRNEKCKVGFTWIAADSKSNIVQWRPTSGEFIVMADGNDYCYRLGSYAGIPANVAVKYFILRFPVNIEVTAISFSSNPSDREVINCPDAKYFARIQKAYKECVAHPKDNKKIIAFVDLLEHVMHKYDCRRSYDSAPVPAWWMCDRGTGGLCNEEDVNKWFTFISKSRNMYARKLFASTLFRSTLDGESAEQFSEDSVKVERELASEGNK
jgi:hypothetical protein